jgi:hypothetical protein
MAYVAIWRYEVRPEKIAEGEMGDGPVQKAPR